MGLSLGWAERFNDKAMDIPSQDYRYNTREGRSDMWGVNPIYYRYPDSTNPACIR